MNYLVLDTSTKYLAVSANIDGASNTKVSPSAMQHSVLLMPFIESTLEEINKDLSSCDFFSCVIGPGSFTGIRIGISSIKAFALAYSKPTLPVTSFDCIAYDKKGKQLALVDAGRGNFYACGYDENMNVIKEPCFLSTEEVLSLKGEFTLTSYEKLSVETEIRDGVSGMIKAVEEMAQKREFKELYALYVKKSQAEENLK